MKEEEEFASCFLTSSTRKHNDSIKMNKNELKKPGGTQGKILMRRKRSPKEKVIEETKQEVKEVPLNNPYKENRATKMMS